MYLNEENYHSLEANKKYLSVSQYKDFVGTKSKPGCEARAMAVINGEWNEEPTIAMLIGSYVDSHFDGTLDVFKAKNSQIYKKDGSDVKRAFQKADEIIVRIERDPKLMESLTGKKQIIMTGQLFGAEWKIKIDNYSPGGFITDLKVVQDIYKSFWVPDIGFMSFVEYWGYDIQGSIYQAIESINTGKEKVPFLIAVADKQKVSNIELIGFNTRLDLEPILTEVECDVPRILELKSGTIKPDRCGICDYCKHTKVITKPLPFRELVRR